MLQVSRCNYALPTFVPLASLLQHDYQAWASYQMPTSTSYENHNWANLSDADQYFLLRPLPRSWIDFLPNKTLNKFKGKSLLHHLATPGSNTRDYSFMPHLRLQMFIFVPTPNTTYHLSLHHPPFFPTQMPSPTYDYPDYFFSD